MLKLGGFAISNYYNKAKIALLEKGIAFEEEHCRTSQEPAMLARSPMGKVPFLVLEDGSTLTESQAIVEYLEDLQPEPRLMPADPLARARVRELIAHLELDVELVARRAYPQAFFGGTISDGTKAAVERDLAKGIRSLLTMAKFSPWIAGDEFTLADCAAAVHLPLVGIATKLVYGADVFDAHPQVKDYMKRVTERPSVRKVADDRKAYIAAQKKA